MKRPTVHDIDVVINESKVRTALIGTTYYDDGTPIPFTSTNSFTVHRKKDLEELDHYFNWCDSTYDMPPCYRSKVLLKLLELFD